jgi:nucleoside-diphosphate-sugar epimerase
MKVAVIGGSSRTADKLVPKLLDGGHEVISLQRSPSSQLRPGVSVSHLDLEAPDAREQMRRGLAGTDAAVFLAGDPRGLNVDRVDLGGTVTGTEVAVSLSIPRWIQVSALGAVGTVPHYLQKPPWPHYLEAKAAGDRIVAASALDWTIVRPGPLTDRGEVGTAHAVPRGAPNSRISRADVAETLIWVLQHPAETTFKTVEVVGGHEPLDTTLAAAFDAAPREA